MMAALRARLARGRLARRVAANAGWLLADRVVRLVIGFVVGVWAARYLGPAQFGQLAFALALAALFSMLVELALEGIVVRALLRHPEDTDRILGSAFWLRMIGGAVGAVAVCVAASIVRPDDAIVGAMACVIALSFLATPFHVVEYWYQSRLESHAPAIARSIAFFLATAVRVGCILATMPVVAFAWLVPIEAALAVVALLVTMRRSGLSVLAWRWSSTEARTLLVAAGPMILAGLAALASTRLDQLLIGALIDDRAVGIYSAATRLTETLNLGAAAIASSLLPAVIALRGESDRRYRAELGRIFALLFALGVAVALPMSLAAEPVIRVLYGPAFAEAAGVLAIHVWSCVFGFLGMALTTYLLAEELYRFALLRMLVALFINVTLNALLIPAMGAEGAAWAALITSAVSVYVLLVPPATREIGKMLLLAPLAFRGDKSGSAPALRREDRTRE